MSFLLDMWENKGEVVTGLLSGVKDTAGDVAGSSLSYIGSLLETDPERKTRIEAEKEALYERRANDPHKRWEGLGYTPGGYGQRSSRVTDGNWFENATANLMHSLGDTYQDFSGIAQEPSQFIKIIGDATTGGILNLVGAEELGQEQQATADAFGGYLAKTYGSWDGFMHHLQTEPVYAIMDLMGAGWIAGKGLNAAEKLAQNPAFISQLESLAPAMERVIKNIGATPVGLSMKNVSGDIAGWHGNPDAQRFRYFNWDKIGTGMGVQKEAWGLFVSGQHRTGQKFAGDLDGAILQAYNHKLNKYLTPVERQVWQDAANSLFPQEAKARAIAKYPNKKTEIDAVIKEFDALHDKASNQLYGVNINEDASKLMMIREAPMTQQPLNVQALAKEHGFPSTTTGRELYRYIAEDFATQIGGDGARKMASEYLASKGIPGMRFLDDMTPDPGRINKAGTLVYDNPKHSWVLFEDGNHKVLTRQGRPVEEVALIDPRYGTPRISDTRAIEQGLLDPDLLRQNIGADLLSTPKYYETNQYNLANFEGHPWVATQADTSRAGGILEGVGTTEFSTPVRFRGGQDYMWDYPNVNAGRIWEMSEGARTAFLRSVAEAQKLNLGKETLMLPFSMKPTAIDFSHQVTETMLQSAIANLNKTQIKKLDRLIKTKSIDKETGNRVNLNWKGANTSDALIGTTGAERKAISNIIDVHFRNVDGVLSLPEARLINADPLQLNKEALTLQNVAQVGKQTGRETSSHPSYGYSIKGDPVGKIVEDISLLDLLPGAKKASGEPMTRANLTNADYRKMTMQQNYGLLTEKILRTLDDQGKLYGGLLK